MVDSAIQQFLWLTTFHKMCTLLRVWSSSHHVQLIGWDVNSLLIINRCVDSGMEFSFFRCGINFFTHFWVLLWKNMIGNLLWYWHKPEFLMKGALCRLQQSRKLVHIQSLVLNTVDIHLVVWDFRSFFLIIRFADYFTFAPKQFINKKLLGNSLQFYQKIS